MPRLSRLPQRHFDRHTPTPFPSPKSRPLWQRPLHTARFFSPAACRSRAVAMLPVSPHAAHLVPVQCFPPQHAPGTQYPHSGQASLAPCRTAPSCQAPRAHDAAVCPASGSPILLRTRRTPVAVRPKFRALSLSAPIAPVHAALCRSMPAPAISPSPRSAAQPYPAAPPLPRMPFPPAVLTDAPCSVYLFASRLPPAFPQTALIPTAFRKKSEGARLASDKISGACML